MKYYRFPENRLTRFGFAAFLLMALALSRDTLITSSLVGFYPATFLMYGVIGLVGMAFLWVNRKHLKQILTDERMILALAASVIFAVPMIAKQDWQLIYISILICIYFAVFLSYFLSLEEVAKIYVVILAVLGIYSCFCTYVLDALADMGILNAPVFSNGLHDFYNFGLSCSAINHSQSYRNFGIFREPGVYQYFVILALLVNNYFVSWDKEWKLWVCNFTLALTMVTTFATGGLVEIALLAVVVFIDKKWYKSKKICAMAAFMIVVMAAIVLYSFVEQNALYKTIRGMVMKLFNLNPTSSAGVRLQAVLFDVEVFLANPLFGDKLSKVMFPEVVNFNTTSTMILLAGYGLFAGCFHVLSWIALLWDRNRKLWVNLALLLVMFMSFNTQDLTANMFFWLFPVMGMVERGIPFVKSLKRKA